MYQETLWMDYVTEFENRYREQNNGDGTITHTPVEGEVVQQGTPQSAKNFNHMEFGISGNETIADLLVAAAIHTRQQLADLAGDVIEVSLDNSEQYPFNDSQETVSLPVKRNNLNYTVQAEITSVTGGFVNEISITEKLDNGFKVEFKGSARNVKLKLYVKGGFYSG